jgi:hypothetical protein
MATPKPRITANNDGSHIIRLRKVRLSFPALFTPRAFEEGKEPSYQASFIMENQDDPNGNIALVKKGIDGVVKAGLKGKHPGKDRICFRSGEEKGDRGIDGYKLTFHVGAGGGQEVFYLHLHFLSEKAL